MVSNLKELIRWLAFIPVPLIIGPLVGALILIPIFLSSETFVLLSFNAIRQGLSIGFLVLATAILIKEIFEKKSPSNYSYIKFWKLFVNFT